MNIEERKRENALRLVEDHIGRHLAESEKAGELQAAPSFGKPLDYGDGYFETPEDLRLANMRQKLAMQLEKLRGG